MGRRMTFSNFALCRIVSLGLSTLGINTWSEFVPSLNFAGIRRFRSKSKAHRHFPFLSRVLPEPFSH